MTGQINFIEEMEKETEEEHRYKKKKKCIKNGLPCRIKCLSERVQKKEKD